MAPKLSSVFEEKIPEGATRTVAESQNGVCKEFHQALVALTDALQRGRLIIVLGAGASIAAGLPSWNDLILQLRDDLGLTPESENPDPRLLDPLYIADMYEKRFDRPSLLRKVVDTFNAVTIPSKVHEAIARLSVKTIFTTNYDDLMERSLEKANKSFHVIHRDEDYAYYPASDQVVVIKLHGDIRNPSRIVLTKSDMLDYETTHPNLLEEFKTSLKKNTALFVGTSMLDPNLERMLELSVRELRENALRHYILVKGWNRNLELYYSQHKLEPLNFDDWNQAVDFLQNLSKSEAKQSKQGGPLAQPLSEGYVAVEKARFDRLASVEEKELVYEYNLLAERYRKGGRYSILEAINALWLRLETTPADSYKSLKVKSLILLSHVTASEGNQSGLDEAGRWLNKAESLADAPDLDSVRELRALLMHLNNETGRALQEIVDIQKDSALYLRLAMLLDWHRFDDSQPLVRRLLPKTKRDEEAALLVARYYYMVDKPERARHIIEPWLERCNENPICLELAGYVYAELAQDRRKEFCRKYNLFPNFSIILFHEQLLDCGEQSHGAKSAVYFEEAAKLLADAKERRRALRCYSNAYAIHHMCSARPNELRRLADLMSELSSDEPVPALNELTGDKPVETLELEDFEKALQWVQFVPQIISRMEEWAAKRGAWAELADFLGRPEFQEQIATVDEQAQIVTVRMKLWEDAGNHENALQVIDSFVPPVEYAYFPLVLRAAHFMHERQDQAAEGVLEKLRQHYGDNPVVLAQLCEWHELKAEWEPMQLAAERLLSMISIPQTYDYYLTSLGRQHKFTQLLDGLKRAETERVELGLVWTHVNHARALFGLSRFEEALRIFGETESLERTTGQKLIKPEDKMHMISAYALTGNRDEALRRANHLVEDNPDFAEGHIAVIQLLLEKNDLKGALDVAKRAGKKFPENEQIQASRIQISLLTGQTENIAQHLRRFQERFPQSRILRTVSQKDGFDLIEQAVKRSHFAVDQYVLGRIPSIQAAFLQSPLLSYFYFWQVRKRFKSGIYVACGEQAEEWQRLQNADSMISANGAVMDYPALITTFELGERFKSWEKLLRKLFPKIYLPASFRAICAIERSSLSGETHVGRYKALQTLRNRFEIDSKRFPAPIQAVNVPDDVLGYESERAFALEHGYFYLNEYGDDEGRIPREFGFQELAVYLSGRRALTESQQKKIERLAQTGRVFQPLPTSRESVKEIVASISTLEALIELDLLEPTISCFEVIHISEIGKARLLEEILSTQFFEDVAERFGDFERHIMGMDDWIEWVSVSEDERNTLVGAGVEQVSGLLKHAMMYVADLFAIALRKKCCLVTDDRASKMLSFARASLEDPTAQILRIGSDTIIRYFYHGSDQLLGRREYLEYYRQLIDWSYRHLPLDPDVVMETWPGEPDLEIVPPESPIQYFSQSLTEYLNVTTHEKRLARNILQNVANEHGRQLASLLRWAFYAEKPKKQVAAIFKLLEPSFISTMFNDRFPESFPLVLANLLMIDHRSMGTENRQSDRHFFEWVESVLELAGISPREIGLAWQSYIVRVVMSDFSEISRDRQMKEKVAVMANVMRVLPEGTRDYVFVPYIKRLLDEKLHLKFVERRKYIWTTKVGETESASVSDEDIGGPPLRELLAAKTGEYIEHGVKWLTQRSRNDDFLLRVGVLPTRVEASEEHLPVLELAAGVIDLIRHPDSSVRQTAWNIARLKLGRFNRATVDWDRLGKQLFDESMEKWEPAAQRCIDFLLSDCQLAVDIFIDMLQGGSSCFVRDLLKLDLEHVRNWLPFGPLRWHDADELREWARIEAKRISGNLGRWKEVRKWAFCSFFPDVEIFREYLHEDLMEVCSSETEVTHQLNILLDEGEESAWPFFKINIVLTVIELINSFAKRYPKVREGDLWTNRQHSGVPIHGRVEELLKGALTPVQALSARAITRESHLLGFSTYLVQALSSKWQFDERNDSVEMRRYLSTVIGGYLATELAQKKRELPHASWLELRTYLFRIATENAWTSPDSARGLYKPSLLGTLEYPACFAVPGLRRHADSVRAYIMSDELRNQFFETAGLHRFFYALSFSLGKRSFSWLDGCLARRHDAGIPEFLAQAAGSSIKYWSDDQKLMVKRLKAPIQVDEALEEYYRAITAGDVKSVEPACIILVKAVWLGYVNQRTGWEDLLLKCLDDEIVVRLIDREDTYRSMLFAFCQLLVSRRASENVLSTITRFLLRNPAGLLTPTQLMMHAEVVLLLLIEGWYAEEFATWLWVLVFDKGVSFGVRRKIVGNISARIDEMSEAVRLQLHPLLGQIAEAPEWKLAPELAQFRRDES